MKKIFLFTLTFVLALVMFLGISKLAIAQTTTITGGPLSEGELLVEPPLANPNQQRGDAHNVATWISKWYSPNGNYTANGGFGTSAPMDLMSAGTGGKITDVSLSTIDGLMMTKDIDVEWGDNHGGTRGWTVFELNTGAGNNTDRGGVVDNYDFYGVLVIDAPKNMTATMSPSHDDHAQIWLNGAKWYNNPKWTGGITTVRFNIEVELIKGANVLVYRCGESGGGAYINMHFDDATHNTVNIYPDTATDKDTFFAEFEGALPVEPLEKLTTTWADIKRKR